MPNYYAAQVLPDGFVHTVCQTLGPVESDKLIPIDSMDISLLGKKHRDGKFYGIRVIANHTEVKAGNPCPIRVFWEDGQGAVVDDTDNVYVNGEALLMQKGEGVYHFKSDTPGEYRLKFSSDSGCKKSIKVVVT